MQAPEAAKPRLLPTLSEYGRRAAERIRAWRLRGGRAPLVSVAVLAVVQWLAILVYALTVRHNGWLFYQGGDQIWLVTTGWLLGQGELAPDRDRATAGRSLLAPDMRFTGPNFVTAMPPVIALNVLVLGPLALWAIYALARTDRRPRVRALRGCRVGGDALRGDPALARTTTTSATSSSSCPGALGLTGLADYQSMVMLLVGALLFMRALERRAWPTASPRGS